MLGLLAVMALVPFAVVMLTSFSKMAVVLSLMRSALGTQQVSLHITDVERGASETGSASSQVHSAAQSLAGESDRLKNQVEQFLGTVRAA